MQTQTKTLAAAAGVALALASTNGLAQSSDIVLRMSTGIEFSSGEFGGTDTIEDLYVPVNLNVTSGRFGFNLTVPYLSVTAPSGTTSTDPGGELVPGAGELTTESGLGDIVGSLRIYDVFYDEERGLALDITGSVKLGTADEDKGLGTGETDYSVSLEGYRFFDGTTLFGAIGYRLRGEPEGVDLNNVLMGSVGAAWSVSDATLFGLALDFRESAVSGFDDIQELSGFASHELSENWIVDVYAFTGFTDSSPDWGAGLNLSKNFERFRVRDGF